MAFKGGVVLGTVSLNATGSGTTAIGATSNTGTIAIGNTSSAAVSIDCGTAGITVGTTANAHATTVGSTNSTSSTTVQSGSGALAITSTNGTWTGNSGTGALGLSTDASATTVSLATGGAVKTVTLGSTNTTSTTTVQSGSGALNITATNGALTMNSGTGTMAIGSDATAQTIGFATGAGAKVATVGSTNGASSLALKYGTADFTLASATGTVMSALDTGEITLPLQPAFLAYADAQTDVTGDGTNYTVLFVNEVFDQNSDFASSTFTAPVTGKYFLQTNVMSQGYTTSFTISTVNIVTSNRTFEFIQNGAKSFDTSTGVTIYTMSTSVLGDMDAADTATVILIVAGSTKTIDITASSGTNARAYFTGHLAC